MALIKCVECGREISDKAAACQGCGAPMQREVVQTSPVHDRAPGSSKAGKVLTVIALLVILPAGVLVAGIELFGNDEINNGRESVRFCHEHYQQLKEDPYVTRDALGIAYGACKKLEQDFRSKWGRDP